MEFKVVSGISDLLHDIVMRDHNRTRAQRAQQERKREGDEQMWKQRKVRVRMRFTLYFLGVKESHFVYRPVKVFFR